MRYSVVRIPSPTHGIAMPWSARRSNKVTRLLPFTGPTSLVSIKKSAAARVPCLPRLICHKSMKTYLRVRVSWTLLLDGLIILLVTVGPSRMGADNVTTARAWNLVQSPSVPGVGQGLYAVTAISGADAWAVGDLYNQALGDQQTLIEHWDGIRWQIVPSPSLRNAYNHLTGVSGTSSKMSGRSVTR